MRLDWLLFIDRYIHHNSIALFVDPRIHRFGCCSGRICGICERACSAEEVMRWIGLSCSREICIQPLVPILVSRVYLSTHHCQQQHQDINTRFHSAITIFHNTARIIISTVRTLRGGQAPDQYRTRSVSSYVSESAWVAGKPDLQLILGSLGNWILIADIMLCRQKVIMRIKGFNVPMDHQVLIPGRTLG